ncbi:glycerol dehydrogenase [Kosakonia oryzendophytica]|uniref:Glycerol dehydrogenase n=1 Tax=Kosakonia oryzendophytica TaxID=1005665 RepID=A0A1C4C285_9ENTR|nr:iron-containing alcohol dehydrogenase family protein [Kosakonia oryzendophytica]SCC13152.1 glycerol dehydrogenase [Kosakonia oryzendophytica]
MLAIKTPQTWFHQSGIRHDAGKYISPLSQHILIITSAQAWARVNPALESSLRTSGVKWQTEIMTGYCTDERVAHYAQRARKLGVQWIVGVGGGRVLDTAKAVADALDGGESVTIPKVASTCAAWSPLSVFYTEEGGQIRSQPLKTLPRLVLVDSEIIAQSDVRYLKAGIVDALAKWYEFRPYLQHSPDNLALQLKVQTARLAVDIYEKHGAQAVRDNKAQVVSEALINVIDANIAIAGLANSIRGEIPTPGVAHAIHNRLTYEPALRDWLHGERVGYSLLVQSFLEGDGETPDAALLSLLRQYEMPLTLAPLKEIRLAVIQAVARSINFPRAAAEHLPFSLEPARIERALRLTEQFFTPRYAV